MMLAKLAKLPEFCQAGQDTVGMGVLTKKVTANVTRNGLSDS